MAALGTTILLTVPPAATAAASPTLAPPFRGTSVTVTQRVDLGASCSAGVAVRSIHWIPTTGNVTWNVTTTASSCVSPPTGDGYADAVTDVGIAVAFPVRLGPSGGHNLSTDLAYAITPTATVSGPHRCPIAKNVPGQWTTGGCSALVVASTYFGLVLYDATNRSSLTGAYAFVWGPENESSFSNASSCDGQGNCRAWSVSTGCAGAPLYLLGCVPSGLLASGTTALWLNASSNCEWVAPWGCNQWQNWTLNGSHRYWLFVTVRVITDAVVNGYGAGLHLLARTDGDLKGSPGVRVTSIAIR